MMMVTYVSNIRSSHVRSFVTSISVTYTIFLKDISKDKARPYGSRHESGISRFVFGRVTLEATKEIRIRICAGLLFFSCVCDVSRSYCSFWYRRLLSTHPPSIFTPLDGPGGFPSSPLNWNPWPPYNP